MSELVSKVDTSLSYRIELSGKAKKRIERLPDNSERQVRRALDDLAENPRRNLLPWVNEGLLRLMIPRGWWLMYRIDDEAKTVLVESAGKQLKSTLKARGSERQWPPLTREEALKIVEAGIGKRPDLPSGAQYVRRIKGIWKGLLPRDRRDS